MRGTTCHTVIIDEAGATAETAMPLLLRLQPNNMILVGDHFQLPPSSGASSANMKGSASKADGINRSLMERCIQNGRSYNMLDLQYRMHPTICSLISQLFYSPSGVPLKTDPQIAKLRATVDITGGRNGAARDATCLRWHDHDFGETPGPFGRSYCNIDEAQLCRKLYRKERKRAGPARSVHIIAM